MTEKAGSNADKSAKATSSKGGSAKASTSSKSDAVIDGEFEEAPAKDTDKGQGDDKKSRDKASGGGNSNEGIASARSSGSNTATNKEKRSFKTKAGWVTSASLVVFIAGLYASPWVEDGLYRWFPNLMPETSQVDLARGNVDTNVRDAITDINADIRDLKNRLQLMAQGVDTLDEESMSMISALAARVDMLESNGGTMTSAGSDQSGANASDASARLQNLENQVADLEVLLDQRSATNVGNDIGGVPQSDEAGLMQLQQDYQARMDQMATQMASLEQQVQEALALQNQSTRTDDAVTQPSSQMQSQLSSMMTRLRTLEQQQNTLMAAQQLGDNATYFAITSARIQQAVSDGRSFVSELNVIKALMLEQSAMQRVQFEDAVVVLSDHAAGGLLPRQVILTRFSDAMDEALKAQDVAEDAGWWQQTKNSLAGLVQVRRTDVTEGSGRDAILNRAETAVNQGDIATALAELSVLSSGPAAAFENWIKSASDHVAAMRASDSLLSTAMAESTRNVGAERPNP